MRYIKTSNDLVEFIEASNEGQILSVRAFQFGELYFQIKNRKVTFYLNDQENPWRNDVWSADIPLQIDEEVYDTEEEASAALHSIMNDSFQEQLDELKEDLAAEEARAQEAEEQLDGKIDDETERAISAETRLQTEITELSGAVSNIDARVTRNTNDISALTDALNSEISRSTAKDAEHDAEISGLSTSLQNEINRAVGAENSLRNDLNNEISARTTADAEQLQRITALEVGKADKSDLNNYYTKTESDNKYATKEYISGLTENIYTKDETNALLDEKADKISSVASAQYNSQNKTIDFKNISGTVISSIDARDFIKDGMVDNVTISNGNLVITFNTDAGKEPISIPLTDIFDPTNYYSKNDIDAKLSGKTDVSAFTAHTADTTIHFTSGDVQNQISAYTYDKQTIDEKVASGGTFDPTNYYTKSEVDASQLAQDQRIDELSGKVETISGDVITLSGNSLTSGEVQTMIDNSISGKQDTLIAGTNITISGNVISASGGGSITIDPSLDSGSTNAVANSAITNAINTKLDKPNFVYFSGNRYSANLLGYKDETQVFNWGTIWQSDGSIGFDGIGNLTVFGKLDTSAITTSVTSASTDSQVPSAKAVYNAIQGSGGGGITSGEVQTMIDNSLSGYQETLSAGTNIQINNNVISATDTTYTAGDGISISNQNVISTTTKFWCGTQAQYDAITTKDPNTVYMIHD